MDPTRKRDERGPPSRVKLLGKAPRHGMLVRTAAAAGARGAWNPIQFVDARRKPVLQDVVASRRIL